MKRTLVCLGTEIADALDFCHRKGMIHRDVKPENIFVDENGVFKIGDFGVARTIDKTSGGMSKKGTEVYMAPEVYWGKEYDASEDTYSLGLVLYRILNGNRLPFLPLAPNPITYEDRENALVKRIKGEALSSPIQASTQVSEIILKACAYKPEDRYKTAGELCLALKEVDNKHIASNLKVVKSSEDIKTAGANSAADYEQTVGIFGEAKDLETKKIFRVKK